MSQHNSKESHTHTLPEFGLDIPIFTKLYEFYKALTQAVAAFPKTKRYTLGQKLDTLTLDILELLFSVPLNPNKSFALQKMSIKLDLLKVLLRLAKDNRCLREKGYLVLQANLQEIGRMLGGWIRSQQKLHDKRLSEKPTSSSD